MKSRKVKRIMSLFLASVMALSMTGCGGSQGGGGAEAKEFVYVPEFQEIEGENISYYNMKYVGDSLYYESYYYNEATQESGESIVKYSLADGSSSTLPLKMGGNMNFNSFAVASDGGIVAVCYDYSGDPGPEGYVEPKMSLCKFGADGETVFSIDLLEALGQDRESTYIQYFALDGSDRCYVAVDSKVFLLDAEGKFQGAVDAPADWISGLGCGRDGKMYITYYDNTAEGNSYALTEINFDQRAVGETYKGFVSGNGNGLYPGTEHDFLIGNGSSVYAYDLKSQKSEKLFDWLDSDINGESATCLGQLEDGRVLAVISDWESGENSVALLTKTKYSEVAQKETILIGAMYNDSDLQSAAVKFNKTNDKYRISIKTYVDYNNWTENAWSDALTNLNNDITSNNCPDIIDLNGLNVQRLAAKGVFEDLSPYLEGSSFQKDDFVDNVLNAYTFDGVLVSIPVSFTLRTIVGRGSDLGDREGWTIDEMIAYADSYPNAQILEYSQKDYILRMCMAFNESAFIDWNTGECKFDTPEFKSLLEFVNRFPDEWQYEDGAASAPTRIQNKEVLLDTCYMSDFDEVQLYKEIFEGDIAYIGYPTTDGGCGTGIMASQAYAITSKSDCKDGAWEFIESILKPKEESDNHRGFRRMWGFPNNKEALRTMAEEAVKEEYLTDENGEVMKDENGEPIAIGGGSSVGYEDGWSYTYRTPTQDEVDIVLNLIEKARPVSDSNGSDEILNIILEEAAGFFQGQKSVDEVTNIIQSRINIYVNENS